MDRTSSLSEAKQLLEFAFFANNHNFESEYEAKLWLDEKRAQFVNQLVRKYFRKKFNFINNKTLKNLLFFKLKK